jgi:hypothetical protein
MKLSIAKQLTAGLLLSMASVFANAGIIDVTESGFDAFKDDVSGLTWIDFNETTSLLRTEISELFDADDLYEGWRFATSTEISDLINNIDLIDGLANGRVAYDSGVSQVLPQMGGIEGRSIFGSDGVTSSLFEVLTRSTFDLVRVRSGHVLDIDSPSYTNLLVKVTDVPEPTTLAIFGLGLAGLAFRRKGTKA